MTFTFRGKFSRIAVAGALLLALAQPWAFAKTGSKISVGDDPSRKKGSPALVLIEVADFQCPYCGKGAREVLPQFHEKFVRTGKVEHVFLDLPLDIHPHAFKAAEAAACAGDQKKFWEMHRHLFANQRDLAPEKLPAHAGQLGLDAAAFGKCLSSGRHAAGILQDVKEVNALGISVTPAYLIGRRIPGGKVEILHSIGGLPPYDYLEKKLNELLAPKAPPK